MAIDEGRKPRQARSQARVERILDAAAAQVAQAGVESITMAGIGAASGSAPGSLYQFFPNRDLLIDALAEREAGYVEACVTETLEDWANGHEATSTSLVDALLPPLLEVYRSRPAWGELLHALARGGEPGTVEQRLDAKIETRLACALVRINPSATPDCCGLAASVLLDFGHTGLLLARHAGSEAVYSEVRRALIAYLDDWCRRAVASPAADCPSS